MQGSAEDFLQILWTNEASNPEQSQSTRKKEQCSPVLSETWPRPVMSSCPNICQDYAPHHDPSVAIKVSDLRDWVSCLHGTRLFTVPVAPNLNVSGMGM